MKYVVAKVHRTNGPVEIPFMFPDNFPHDLIYRSMEYSLMEKYDGASVSVISAGFVSARENGIICYGNSETLKVYSRNEIDTKLINAYLDKRTV